MSITHDSDFNLPTSFSSVPSVIWGENLNNGSNNIAKYTVSCISSASGRENANTSLRGYFPYMITSSFFKESSRPEFSTSSYGYKNFAGFGMETASSTKGPYIDLSYLGEYWTISFFYTTMKFSAKGSGNGTIFSIADDNYMFDIETNSSGNVYLYSNHSGHSGTRSLGFKLEAGIPYAFVISRNGANLYFRVYDTRNGNGTFYGTAQLNPYSIAITDYFTSLNSFKYAWFGFGCCLTENANNSYIGGACSAGYFQSIIILKNVKCIDTSDGKKVVWNRPLYWQSNSDDTLISTAVIKGQKTPELGLIMMNLDMTKDKYLELLFFRIRGGRVHFTKNNNNAVEIGDSSSNNTFSAGVLVNNATAYNMFCSAGENSYKINGNVYDSILLFNNSYYLDSDDFKKLNVNGISVADVRCNSSSVNAVKCNDTVVYARKATLSFNIATTSKAIYCKLTKIGKPNGDSYGNNHEELIVFNEGTTNSTFTFTALYGETWRESDSYTTSMDKVYKYTLTGDGDFKITVSE